MAIGIILPETPADHPAHWPVCAHHKLCTVAVCEGQTVAVALSPEFVECVGVEAADRVTERIMAVFLEEFLGGQRAS